VDKSKVRSKDDLPVFLDKIKEKSTGADFDIDVKPTAIEKPMYDDEGVVACPKCNSLFIVTKRGSSLLECRDCGVTIKEDELIKYKTIYSYLLGEYEDSEDNDID